MTDCPGKDLEMLSVATHLYFYVCTKCNYLKIFTKHPCYQCPFDHLHALVCSSTVVFCLESHGTVSEVCDSSDTPATNISY